MNWRFWRKKTPEMRFAEKIARTLREIPIYTLPKRKWDKAIELELALSLYQVDGSSGYFERLLLAVQNYISCEDEKVGL